MRTVDETKHEFVEWVAPGRPVNALILVTHMLFNVLVRSACSSVLGPCRYLESSWVC